MTSKFFVAAEHDRRIVFRHKLCTTSPDAPSTDSVLQTYAAFIDAIAATNITVRKCKFFVTSTRAGFMSASMRFDYKEHKKWSYDPNFPPIYEDGWLLQPLPVQPRRLHAAPSVRELRYHQPLEPQRSM